MGSGAFLVLVGLASQLLEFLGEFLVLVLNPLVLVLEPVDFALDPFQRASILVRHPDETVLFVSHGGTMATLLLRLFGEQLSEEQYLQRVMANSGVTILEVRDGRAHLTLFNCTRHLR